MEQSKFYIDNSGDRYWYLPSKGKDYWHRINGPAIEVAYGSKYWYVDDKLHRLDGPAIEYLSGIKEWWVDGKYIIDTDEMTGKIENWLEENEIDLKTKTGQLALILRWT